MIRNASKEFTHNEMNIFDDIVNIVFDENPLKKIRSFFGMNLNNDKKVTEFAKKHGAKGLVNLKYKDGALTGPIVKFLSEPHSANAAEAIRVKLSGKSILSNTEH